MTPEKEWQLACRIRIIEHQVETNIQKMIWGEDVEKLK